MAMMSRVTTWVYEPIAQNLDQPIFATINAQYNWKKVAQDFGYFC
jgi:hypothetical protein